MRQQKGSTLTWVMVVAVVLVLLLGVGLTLTTYSHNQATNTHVQNQAYYTALSTAQTFEQWLKGSDDAATPQSEKTEIAAFLTALRAAPAEGVTVTLTAAQLPYNAGSCVVNFAFVDAATQKQLKITSTATYVESTATVSLTMTQGGGAGGLGTLDDGTFAYPTSDFATGSASPKAGYDSEASTINSGQGNYLSDPNPINVVGKPDQKTISSYATNDWSRIRDNNYNAANQALVDGQIAADTRNREVTFFEYGDYFGANRDSGPREIPWIDGDLHKSTSNAQNLLNRKIAKVVTPQNPSVVKFVFNPVSQPTAQNLTFYSKATDNTNTKWNFMNIDDYAGKDVYVRLANQSGVAKRTSNIPYNVVVGFDFMDNDTPAQSTAGITWWTQKWNSATIYTKDLNPDTEGINSNIILGPYMRIHTSDTLDYWGWATYVNKHHGYIGEQYAYANAMHLGGLADAGDYSGPNTAGFPFAPQDWDKIGLYFLDRQPKYVHITQGVNIHSGVIYSNRELKIGGALTPYNTSAYTYESVNSAGAGLTSTWVDYILYWPYPHTLDQVIENTDIVLVSTDGTVKNSVIRHPDSWVYATGRKLSILGGTIYVGNKQNLTIESEVKNGLSLKAKVQADGITQASTKWETNQNYTENGNTMDIKPDKIEVAAGGSLTITGNANKDLVPGHDNIETDIYVNGGVLTIQAGATIRGNIYVYNGGEVKINGSFRLDSKHADTDPQQAADGIFIYGQAAVSNAQLPNVTSAGRVTFAAGNVTITGSANKVHLMDTYDELKTPASAPLAQVDVSLCASLHGTQGHDPATGQCQHAGSAADGGWVTDGYSHE